MSEEYDPDTLQHVQSGDYIEFVPWIVEENVQGHERLVAYFGGHGPFKVTSIGGGKHGLFTLSIEGKGALTGVYSNSLFRKVVPRHPPRPTYTLAEMGFESPQER